MCYLKPMEDSQFENYVTHAIKNDEQELIKSGELNEKTAGLEAKNAFFNLLPEGLKTNNQFLFNIRNETHQNIGMIWYGLRSNQEAFIYDFEIDQKYRGQGYGKKTLLLLEEHARSLGIKKLSLHVFGHNENAYVLYQKMGDHAYSIHMSKEI